MNIKLKKKDKQLLNLLKSHINFAFVEKEGLHIRIEWVESNPEIIKELKGWLLNDNVQ